VALLLRRVDDPTPEDAALATLIAFGLQDLWATRVLLENLWNKFKGL
jgi:hypothetical protein